MVGASTRSHFYLLLAVTKESLEAVSTMDMGFTGSQVRSPLRFACWLVGELLFVVVFRFAFRFAILTLLVNHCIALWPKMALSIRDNGRMASIMAKEGWNGAMAVFILARGKRERRMVKVGKSTLMGQFDTKGSGVMIDLFGPLTENASES